MKIFERGRSMIEMLGVLAVIGVLSVTSVYGYRMAMDKYLANEIFRELNMRANHVAVQLLNGQNPDVSQIGNAFVKSNTYAFVAAKDSSDAQKFKITVTGNISDKVCQQLFFQVGTNSVIRSMGQASGNYASAADCEGQGEKESLIFTFNNDLNKN